MPSILMHFGPLRPSKLNICSFLTKPSSQRCYDGQSNYRQIPILFLKLNINYLRFLNMYDITLNMRTRKIRIFVTQVLIFQFFNRMKLNGLTCVCQRCSAAIFTLTIFLLHNFRYFNKDGSCK